MPFHDSQFVFARRRESQWIHAWSLLLLVCFGLRLSGWQGLAETSKEYQIKAVCLWRLAQFVEWPADAFKNADSPIVIGVLGDNPFGEALDVATRGETAHGRKLVVQHYKKVEDARSSHILFISKSETPRLKEVLAALTNRSILTVSDMEEFVLSYGGMLRMFVEQNKIKMRVNLDAVKPAGLVLDARLLRMVEVIKGRQAQ